MEIVEKSGLFHVIGPDGLDYGRGATREMAEGLLAWVLAENHTRQELIDAVKRHAQQRYDQPGWAVLVDGWHDADVDELIGGATTVEQAIAAVAVPVSVWEG